MGVCLREMEKEANQVICDKALLIGALSQHYKSYIFCMYRFVIEELQLLSFSLVQYMTAPCNIRRHIYYQYTVLEELGDTFN